MSFLLHLLLTNYLLDTKYWQINKSIVIVLQILLKISIVLVLGIEAIGRQEKNSDMTILVIKMQQLI